MMMLGGSPIIVEAPAPSEEGAKRIEWDNLVLLAFIVFIKARSLASLAHSPPRLENMISDMRRGIGSREITLQSSIVTGARRSMVVTLSRKAEKTPVAITRRTRSCAGAERSEEKNDTS